MSRRPIAEKQAARRRKSLRNTPPAFFDLVQWLIDHKHASTRKAARELILGGRVKSGSHVIGVEKDQQVVTRTILGAVKVERKDTVNPRVPRDIRSTLMVLSG
jgi:hypothetical protein